MKKLVYIKSLFVIFIMFISCNDDFLNTVPLDKYSETAVWNDPVLVELFVTNIYSSIEDPYDQAMTAVLTDEGFNTHNSASCQNFTKGLVTPDNLCGFGPIGSSGNGTFYYKDGDDVTSAYKSIRKCNIFLERIDKVPFSVDEQDLKTRMKGEVYFLRAYFYHNLVGAYGGIPIIDYTFDMDMYPLVPRDTYEDCINFIVSDLDKAAQLLHGIQTTSGHITEGAALALKSTVLLYAASDLHNPDKNSTLLAGYSNPELLGYTTSNALARWQAARDAAKAVIDLGTYSLYKGNPAPEDSTAKNYCDLFLSKSMTSEDIFLKFYSVSAGTGSMAQLRNGPNGWKNWGSNTPLQDFVDCYEMKDGTKFDWNNPVHAANPYKNRDPRFHATILYNGAYWKPRTPDGQEQEALYPDLMTPGCVQSCHWQVWKEDPITHVFSEVKVPGLDTRQGPLDSWNGSYTGYYIRKWLDPTVYASFTDNQEIPWRYMRYAEVLLNYAEACIELEEEDDARDALNLIRKRSGMPDITDTGNDLKERCRNERKIELAFEDKRYFDIRRWMIADEVIVPAHDITIEYPMNPDHTTSTVPTYTVSVFDQRTWDNANYFMPIPRDEMNRNNLLIQNPFYQ